MNQHTEAPEHQPPRSKKPRRRAIVVSACVAGALLLGGGATAAFALVPTSKPAAQKQVKTATAKIEQGTLQGSTNTTGTLAYGAPRGMNPTGEGTVTWLPAAGSQVKIGGALYAVDNQQVFLFQGSLPAWRSFEVEMKDGPDVKQLEASLKQLGTFGDEPDERFDWVTRASIQEWQKATGQEQTGTIDFGRIVFETGDVRISEVKGALGTKVDPANPIVTVTDLEKRVEVDLSLTDQKLGVVGAKVDITLPDGRTTKGTVRSVGAPTEKGEGEQKKVVIPVALTLDKPSDAGNLQQASVTVAFPSEKRENVLSVPVSALLALPGNRFGVEIVRSDGTTKRVPVQAGLFAGSRVEISGDGIAAGDDVAVPKV